MSEQRTVVLRTHLFNDQQQAPVLGKLAAEPRTTEFVIDIEAMTTAEWTRVLEAILNHDRCITL
ncbi:MAG: hypothetical protein ACR2RB_17470 [Gammaproteobacteria bacterium]